MPCPSREEQQAFQRRWLADRRNAFFADRACVKCGATDDLHLHHRDPSQKESHRIWSWTEERRDAEIAKCDVLCGPCHRELHAALRRKCGLGGYKRGCRCEVCRNAKRESNARYIANKKAKEVVVSVEFARPLIDREAA